MLNVNVINAKSTQKVEVKPGQPTHLKVDANTRLELVDSASGKAPTQIKARRVGDNLEIVTDEKAQIEDTTASNAQAPDLVLEDYFKQADVSLYAGTGQEAVSYVPVDGAASSSYAAMFTSATTGAALAAAPLLSPWMGVAAGAGVAAAAGGGGGGGGAPVANQAPVAKDDTKSVTENGRLEGTVPIATDADGTIVRYELVGKMADSDGILIFNADGTYKFWPSSFDYLAEGEKATVAFKYVAVDNNGVKSDPKTVTIDVTGTNDLPDIVAVETVDKVDNFTVLITETDKGISAKSTLTIQDKDLSESVIFKTGATKVNFEGTTFMDINPDESLDVVNFVLPLLTLQAQPGKLVNEPHNLTWSFDYQDADAPFFDLIPDGETLMLNYTIEVVDAQGAVKTEVVTVSIKGTNDNPQIELIADQNGSDVVELEFNESANNFQNLSGTLSIQNMDLTDANLQIKTSVSVNEDKSILGEYLKENIESLEEFALIQFKGSNAVSVPNLPHNYSWSFNPLNFIPEGEIVSFDYTIEAYDDVSGLPSDSQIINITITGVNDAPVIFASQGDSLFGQVTMESLASSGSITVFDFDGLFGDSLGEVEITKIFKNGTELAETELLDAKETLKFEGNVNALTLNNIDWSVDYSEYSPGVQGVTNFTYEIQVSDGNLFGKQSISIGFIA